VANYPESASIYGFILCLNPASLWPIFPFGTIPFGLVGITDVWGLLLHALLSEVPTRETQKKAEKVQFHIFPFFCFIRLNMAFNETARSMINDQ
jgi:hypothetical protein